MKVYLQYPWRFPDSPYYKFLIENPPKNVKYLSVQKQMGVITSKKFFWISNFLKRNIRRVTKLFKLTILNAHLSPNKNYDLIHCAHCLSSNKNKPWVTDIEMIPSFAISGWNTNSGQEKIKKYLENKNCKKIMPWTESIKKEIIQKFPEIKEKVEVIYPAVPLMKKIKKKNKKIKIIFIARYFDIKGGLIALEVLDKLRKKYDIEGIVVSNVSKKLKEKYPKIEIYPLMPQRELFNLMGSSDIFLYPSSVDTFGFSLLEAMSFGLPIVTINTNWTKSRKEIVENGKNGFIFDVKEKLSYKKIGKIEEEIINKMINNCEKIIKNGKLREEISKKNIDVIRNGKFSIKERNKKLKKIYEEALK